MYRFLTVALFLAPGLPTTVAHADFIVIGSQPQVAAAAASVPPGTVADDPHIDPGDRRSPIIANAAPPSRPHVVSGFGDDVPLSFACRQIVPARIKVSFGPGADPDMRVSWKGGSPWPVVLSQAITPLGLHMVESDVTLRIQR